MVFRGCWGPLPTPFFCLPWPWCWFRWTLTTSHVPSSQVGKVIGDTSEAAGIWGLMAYHILVETNQERWISLIFFLTRCFLSMKLSSLRYCGDIPKIFFSYYLVTACHELLCSHVEKKLSYSFLRSASKWTRRTVSHPSEGWCGSEHLVQE